MPKYPVAYIATAIVFFGLDFIWLSTATSRFYRPLLGGLLLEKPNMTVAALFYLVYVAGLVVFAVAPALEAGSWSQALGRGMLLGLIAYGTYDFTNLATLKGWPLLVSAVDILWGIVLSAGAATMGFLITRKMTGS
jgi:uncharacterized membrane protein